MPNNNDRFVDEDFEVAVEAEKVKSAEDFLNFLGILERGILEDDEVDKRLQLEFVEVVSRKLNYAERNPDLDASIEMPDQPDWNWLARLFLVGAFETESQILPILFVALSDIRGIFCWCLRERWIEG